MTKLHQKKSQNNQQKKQIVERIAYPHPSCRKCFKICTISAPNSQSYISTIESNLMKISVNFRLKIFSQLKKTCTFAIGL